MKEELTREVLEAMKGCEGKDDCNLCPSNDFCNSKDAFEREALLATALLEEMDKPKVWHGAPETANIVDVYWSDKTGFALGNKRYTRELPKTRARIMAEEIASAKISNEKDLVDIIEQTLSTHMKELKRDI